MARNNAREAAAEPPEPEPSPKPSPESVDRPGDVDGAPLEPIGYVERELTRPDGTTVVVEVPVYPPFRLAEGGSARKPARDRIAPSLKRRRAKPGSGGA